MKIHDQLKVARRQRHMTQGDVAKAAGMTRETYTRIERGKSTTVTTMEALGDLFGMTLTFDKKSDSHKEVSEKKSQKSKNKFAQNRKIV